MSDRSPPASCSGAGDGWKLEILGIEKLTRCSLSAIHPSIPFAILPRENVPLLLPCRASEQYNVLLTRCPGDEPARREYVFV